MKYINNCQKNDDNKSHHYCKCKSPAKTHHMVFSGGQMLNLSLYARVTTYGTEQMHNLTFHLLRGKQYMIHFLASQINPLNFADKS